MQVCKVKSEELFLGGGGGMSFKWFTCTSSHALSTYASPNEGSFDVCNYNKHWIMIRIRDSYEISVSINLISFSFSSKI